MAVSTEQMAEAMIEVFGELVEAGALEGMTIIHSPGGPSSRKTTLVSILGLVNMDDFCTLLSLRLDLR